jgi:23S rRNA pseudouridine2604 synthase
MAQPPRKTLGLPARAAAAVPVTARKPVRGGAPKDPRQQRAELEITAIAAPRERTMQQKPRGTPSRAPVPARSVQLPAPAPVRQDDAAQVKTVQSGVRVSKLMAERGLCSRREADSYIERGWVFVDGERLTELGTRADPSVTIKLDKGARAAQSQQMTILLHKPVGFVSGQPEPGFIPAVTLILPENQYRTPESPIFHASHLKGLAPAGRLDIDSTGLLVLTQDGRVARQLIGENSTVDKEYLVRVEGHLEARGLALLNHGLSLDGHQLKPAKVEWLNDDQLRFVLNEGRKRQIRRMCELVGLRAVGLKRVRIGKVKLSDLPLGQWRFLRDDEVF